MKCLFALILLLASVADAQQVYNFFKPPGMGCQNPNAQTGTTYTLVLSDQCVTMNNSAANTVTIPTNASVAFPIGTVETIQEIGTGVTTIAPAGGVTITNIDTGGTPAPLVLVGQWGMITLRKTATDTWNADLSPHPQVSALRLSGGPAPNIGIIETLDDCLFMQLAVISSSNTNIALTSNCGADLNVTYTNERISTNGSSSLQLDNQGGDLAGILIADTGSTSTLITRGPTGIQSAFGCQGANPTPTYFCGWFTGTSGSDDAIWFTESNHNFILGGLWSSTSATDGFTYLPAVAGTPTGVPAHITGTPYSTAVPFEFDTTHNTLWTYNSGWIQSARQQSGTFTITYTGMTAGVTGTAVWNLTGNTAQLFFPAAVGTSNATTFTATGLPAAIQPTRTQDVFLCDAEDNGASTAAVATFTAASGTVTLSKGFTTAGAWTNAGAKGIIGNGCTTSYLIN